MTLDLPFFCSRLLREHYQVGFPVATGSFEELPHSLQMQLLPRSVPGLHDVHSMAMHGIDSTWCLHRLWVGCSGPVWFCSLFDSGDEYSKKSVPCLVHQRIASPVQKTMQTAGLLISFTIAPGKKRGCSHAVAGRLLQTAIICDS